MLTLDHQLNPHCVKNEYVHRRRVLLAESIYPINRLHSRRVLQLGFYEDKIKGALQVYADAKSPGRANKDVQAAREFKLGLALSIAHGGTWSALLWPRSSGTR